MTALLTHHCWWLLLDRTARHDNLQRVVVSFNWVKEEAGRLKPVRGWEASAVEPLFRDGVDGSCEVADVLGRDACNRDAAILSQVDVELLCQALHLCVRMQRKYSSEILQEKLPEARSSR